MSCAKPDNERSSERTWTRRTRKPREIAYLRREADRARVAIGRSVVRLVGDSARAMNPRYLARERPILFTLLGLGVVLSIAVTVRRRIAARRFVGRAGVAAYSGRGSFVAEVVRIARGVLLSALLTRLLAVATSAGESANAEADPRPAGENP